MKTPAQVTADVVRRISRTWSSDLTGDIDTVSWPHRFTLGTPSGAQLADAFTALLPLVRTYREWASANGLTIEHATRRVMGTDQTMPTHVVVPTIDVAAALGGVDWIDRLSRGRHRAKMLTAGYAHLERPDRTLAACDVLSDVDFDLLCRAADWFRNNDATGMTPRQVPVEGLHAKWLNTRHNLLRDLVGTDDLGLLPPHPSRIHFTYLDPAHRAAGRRRYDSATVGDLVDLPYQPAVVIISENKDTAIHFPELDGGVAIEGAGRGASAFATLDWVTNAPLVVYWGDMDADGLEILNEFRAAGVPAQSLFMDMTAYEKWERFGARTDAKGRPLTARAPRPVPHLTVAEADLYQFLISQQGDQSLRVEQERIPLAAALSEVMRIASCPGSGLGPWSEHP